MTSAVTTPRLVAADLDGTLLDASSKLSPATVAAVAAAAERGIEMVVATGRSHWSARSVVAPLQHVRWLICSNGAVVIDRHENAVVEQRPIGDLDANNVMMSVQSVFPEAGFAWETENGLFFSDRFRANRERTRPGVVSSGMTSPALTHTERAGMLRIMIAHPELVQHEWLATIAPHLPEHLEVSTSSADFVEVCGPGVDKGTALAALCDSLGVASHHVTAFGDHANDIGMLAWAGTSYVMENADHVMKDGSSLIAPHHADDGVASILDTL